MKLGKFIRKYKAEITGLPIGAAAGFAYWYFVGCSTGTCAITSSPVNSTIYGSIMGALVAGLMYDALRPSNKTKTNKTEEI